MITLKDFIATGHKLDGVPYFCSEEVEKGIERLAKLAPDAVVSYCAERIKVETERGTYFFIVDPQGSSKKRKKPWFLTAALEKTDISSIIYRKNGEAYVSDARVLLWEPTEEPDGAFCHDTQKEVLNTLLTPFDFIQKVGFYCSEVATAEIKQKDLKIALAPFDAEEVLLLKLERSTLKIISEDRQTACVLVTKLSGSGEASVFVVKSLLKKILRFSGKVQISIIDKKAVLIEAGARGALGAGHKGWEQDAEDTNQ